MNTSVRPQNSTTVRAKWLGLQATRAGFRLLGSHAPDLAARWAEQLFLTARRYERPSFEVEALRSAAESRVPYGRGHLPLWTWSPTTTRPELASPRTVLLVHGWEGRGSQLASFVPPLLARGFRVVTFDAPGHGDSTVRRASLIEHARAVGAVAEAIGPLFGVVGHSVGGAAILLATRSGLEVSRIALVSPPFNPEKFATTFKQTLGLDDAVTSAMLARLRDRYGVGLEDLDVRNDAEHLHRPLLVVHDRDDRVVPFEAGEVIANVAPQGELLPVSGLGHRAILRAPQVIDTVAGFLDDGAEPHANFAETLDGELFMRSTRWVAG
jgi:pimeloyl-ACP methyl ester carboxylesterase